jgi:hypothetical protein
LCAAVVQTSVSPAAYYIALTIKPASTEYNTDMFGIRKIAVFSKENSRHFLERSVEIIPTNPNNNIMPISHFLTGSPKLSNLHTILENSSDEDEKGDSFPVFKYIIIFNICLCSINKINAII